MRGLARIGGREMWHVLDDDVGTLKVCLEHCIVVFDFVHAVCVGGYDASALGLMEGWIMRAVYLVAPVDVGGEEPLCLALFEHLDFVGGGVGAEHEVPVDVVAVGDGAARMVCREGEEVKVLVRGDERREGGEMGVGWKVGLDEGAKGAEGMGGLGVEPEGELREDRGGHVGHVVGRVLSAEHGHRRGTRRRGDGDICIGPERTAWTRREWETHLVDVGDDERLCLSMFCRRVYSVSREGCL